MTLSKLHGPWHPHAVHYVLQVRLADRRSGLTMTDGVMDQEARRWQKCGGQGVRARVVIDGWHSVCGPCAPVGSWGLQGGGHVLVCTVHNFPNERNPTARSTGNCHTPRQRCSEGEGAGLGPFWYRFGNLITKPFAR